jgi:LysM repeat protein
MAITLKNESVWLTVPGGEHSAQAVVEGALALEGELESIVDLGIVPVVENVQVEEGKVTVRGSLNVDLLYGPSDGWGGLALCAQSWQRCLPFEQELEVDEAKEGMDAAVELSISGSRHEGLGKELDLTTMVSVLVKLSEQRKSALATDALSIPPGLLSLEKKIISFTVPLDNIKEQTSVDGILLLPPEQPELAEIIQGSARVRATDLNLNGNTGQAEISGVMDLSILYWTPAPEGVPPQLGSVDLRGVLPFHLDVNIPALGEKVRGKVNLVVEDFQLVPQAPREVAVSLNLSVRLDLYEQRKLRVVTDLSSKGELQVAQRKDSVSHQVLVGENSSQFSVQGGLVLPAGELPIAQMLRLVPFVNAQEVRMVDEKVVVEALVGFDLLYLVDEAQAESPFRTVTWNEALRLEQMVQVNGATAQMTPGCELEVAELEWELLDPSSLRVRLGGKVYGKVMQKEELELVVEATDVTQLEDDISMVYYIVQRGDTPWKVASRYGQSVESLLATNEEVDFVPGSHLLILNGVS